MLSAFFLALQVALLGLRLLLQSAVRLYSLSVTKQVVVPTFEDCNAEGVSKPGM